jgi:uncharacterized protein YuzE
MEPLVRYDAEADAFSVRVSDKDVARTVVIDDAHYVDLDDQGAVVAIEVLTPDDPQVEAITARFGIEDLAPVILEAIRQAIPDAASTSPGLFVAFDEAMYFVSDFSLVQIGQPPVTAVASGVAGYLSPEMEPVG